MLANTRYPRQSDRTLRDRRPARRCRRHRPQDHRRHLRRRGAARRRRVLGQGSVQGRPLGRVRGALRRQEHRRRGPRAPVPGAGLLCDRRRQADQRDRLHRRHRQDRRREDRRARQRALRPAAEGHHPDARSAAPDLRKTAAYGHFGRDEPEFTWEATDRAAALRDAAGLGAEGRREAGARRSARERARRGARGRARAGARRLHVACAADADAGRRCAVRQSGASCTRATRWSWRSTTIRRRARAGASSRCRVAVLQQVGMADLLPRRGRGRHGRRAERHGLSLPRQRGRHDDARTVRSADRMRARRRAAAASVRSDVTVTDSPGAVVRAWTK